ncbi:hypothetical protein F4677DRAFT_172827 [Hypoxylon crocopeplum]|nr:hypothetical protein F4677DRAFT_172827 [Hypoxylon crocopeplum]
MAEFDDIEYEGIGEDRHILVGSERCFRDYSPGETIISLSDNGQAIYSSPVPTFMDPPGNPPTQPYFQERYGDAVDPESPTIPFALSRNGLRVAQRYTTSPGNGLSPLTRYCREAQAHEQLALGIVSDDCRQDQSPATSPQYPKSTKEDEKEGMSPPVSSLRLNISPKGSIDRNRPSGHEALSGTELREILDKIESAGWEDDTSPEEQMEYLRRATMLKRRVQSETNPRESRPPKVRKRQPHASKGQQSSSP